MANLLDTERRYRQEREAPAKRRRLFIFSVSLASVIVFTLGALGWYQANKPRVQTLSFTGQVDFGDGRNESRQMIEFSFLLDPTNSFTAKKEVSWAGSEFEVDIAIPDHLSPSSVDVILDHPGYERQEVTEVRIVGGDGKLPPVSLERKWGKQKKLKQAQARAALEASRNQGSTQIESAGDRKEALARRKREAGLKNRPRKRKNRAKES